MRKGFIVCVLGLFIHAFATAHAKKQWTYLFYIAGDEQEIDRYSRVPIRKLEQIGSDENRWFIAHADFHLDETGKQLVSEPARRYQIQRYPGPIDPKEYATLTILSPVVWSSRGETNSGSAASLEEFLTWGVREYPADHYALFILGHSWGWRGIGQDFNPGFEVPKNPSGPEIRFLMASLGEVRQAIRKAFPDRKLDLLVMDSCNMGVLEFLYDLGDRVGIFVGTANEMPFMSFDYVKTMASGITEGRSLARFLVSDALASLARGGSQAVWEGDYSALSLFAIDMERMDEFWSRLRRLLKKLSPSLFRTGFLGEKNPAWLDGALNVDLVEFLKAQGAPAFLSKHGGAEESALLLRWLGDEGVLAPDSRWMDFHVAQADEVSLTFQGDELLGEEKSLEKAKEIFAYLNPHLRSLEKVWGVQTTPGGRVIRVRFLLADRLRVRPYIAGASWFEISFLKKGQLLYSKRFEQPRTFYVRTEYPLGSPYLVSGHTFGAGRSHGMSLSLDPEVSLTEAENYHFELSRWIGGRAYYQSLNFSKEFGWADLLFQESEPNYGYKIRKLPVLLRSLLPK